MARSLDDIIDSKISEKLDVKFEELQRNILSNMHPSYAHNGSGNRRGNQRDRPFQTNRGQGYGSNNQYRGNAVQNRGQNFTRGRGGPTGNGSRGRSNSRGRGRGSGSQSRGQNRPSQPNVLTPAIRVVEPETEVVSSNSNLDEKKKKIYMNPLIPIDSRISKKWSKEEVDLFKGKFGTNAEQQYLKQYTNFTIDEAQSNANRCACELVLNCIPKKFGTYAEKEAHDLRESIRVLKEADPAFEGHEVVHAQRHPGQENTELDFIKVTVLFTNSQTPDRIATKAEKNRDTTMFQRSVPKNIRLRNETMGVYIENLNSLRPKNCPYLWSTVLIRGETHRIQRADPSFVPQREPEAEVTENLEQNPRKDGLRGAITALKGANAIMAATGPEAPMGNIPILTVNEALAELKEKHNGNMELACQELLLNHGLPDKMHLRKSRKTSKSSKT